MKKTILFKHKGVTLKITQRIQSKHGSRYADFIITDYTSGKRVRHARASLEEAKAKAEDICEGMVTGRAHVLDIKLRDEICRALDALRPTGIAIDAACLRFAEMVKITGSADVLLSAAYLWRERGPNKPLTPKPVKKVVDEFLAQQQGRVSPVRHRTNSCYLTKFASAFIGRSLHEIQVSEVDDLTRACKWSQKTRNDFLNCTSQMYKWAMQRLYTQTNPASSEVLQRERLPGSDICIFTAEEARKIMFAIKDDLKPFMALCMWSGLRKMEITRLTWDQVNAGLASGSIFLQSSATKTKQSRNVPICDTLRLWLERYRKATGPLLPAQWRADNDVAQMYQLNNVTQYVKRKAKIGWNQNAPRHSFCTYRIKVTGDPSGVADEMGTSLAKIEKHYRKRSSAVTLAMAQEWFAVLPGGIDKILPMPSGPSTESCAGPANKAAAA